MLVQRGADGPDQGAAGGSRSAFERGLNAVRAEPNAVTARGTAYGCARVVGGFRGELHRRQAGVIECIDLVKSER